MPSQVRSAFRPPLLSAFLVLLTAFMGLGAPARAAGLFGQSRYAAIVVDASTGEVLYSKRADALRYPASITKIMTLYLTFEALSTGRLSLKDRVPISAHAAAQMPSKTNLRPGDSLSVEEAIKAVAVHSANDIAVALAERIGGSEARFANLMTLRAQELGMANTRFVNANGVPDTRQVTTARDIAILSRAAMRDYPQYYGYFGVRSFELRGVVYTNHNHLLREPGYDGFKTGFTNAAGWNLSASAVRDGRRLITVVLGGSSAAARDENVQTLMNAGFDVLKRRALGVRTTIAQNIAEPDDTAPIDHASIEQGDGPDIGLKVELNDLAHRDQLLSEEKRLDMTALPSRPPVVKAKTLARVCRGHGRHRRCSAPARARLTAARAETAAGACERKRGRALRRCERRFEVASVVRAEAHHRRLGGRRRHARHAEA